VNMASPESTEQAITKLLRDAHQPGTNTLNIEGVRRGLAEYLGFHAEELISSPDLVGRPHWELLAADTDPARPAVVGAAYFDGDRVVLASGHGDSAVIRAFGDSEFPDDPSQVLEALAARIALGRVELPRAELDAWLGPAAQ
jgi:hypothetical protein